MFDLDKWTEIWITMKKHKLRTALTAFGVFWGIFMLVILLGAGKGLYNGATQNFDIAKNAVFVWTEQTSIPYAGFQAGRSIDLTNDDYLALQQLPEVKSIAPRNRVTSRWQGSTLAIERGDRSVSYQIMADYPNFLDIKPYVINEGRFINQIDIEHQRKTVCIGRRVRDELFGPEEQPLGEYIRIGNIPFQVVGVFDTRLTGQDAINDLQTVHVPHTTAQNAFNMPNEVHWFGFVPSDGVSAYEAEEAIKNLFRQRHKIAPNDRQALGSFNVEENFKEIQGVFTGISAFSWLVAIGTIIAGMVGVGNIMLIIVKERTKEIGIRKSLGAKPWSIINMIVLEALVITGISGYVGLVLGVGIIEGIAYAMDQFGMDNPFFKRPEINFDVAFLAIMVLLLSGVLAGLFPGLKAAKVSPVVALRDD
ncbi:MAG: ABC transporter permease [Cytophagales bacterium]|nr:ABC transporter permease [Cytophagales bacterium]